MKKLASKFTVMKVTLLVIIAICTVFVIGLISDSIAYNTAIEDIATGRYERAREALCSIEKGYRDRDALIEYIDLLSKYDPRDPASVYHCYRSLNSICAGLEGESLESGALETCRDIGHLYSTLGAGQGLG